MLLGDVIDELHDYDGLSDAGAAEQADLPAFQEGLDEIDDLHASLEHFGSCRLLVKCRCRPVDRISLLVVDGTELIDGFADHIHHSPKRAAAHGNGDRAALIDGFHAPDHAVCRFHGNTAHASFPEVLLHFENDVDGDGNIEAVADDFHGFIDGRQGSFGELHVHRGSCDLNYVSDVFCHNTSALYSSLLALGSLLLAFG